jgi:opacity protein-like surface antigen
MKKVFLSIVAVALITASASAQLFVGGSMNFSTSSGSMTSGSVSVDGPSSYVFGLNPMVGVYLDDQMAVGAKIGFAIDGGNDNAATNPTTNSGTKFEITPFFRYHLLELGSVSVFGQAEIGLGFESSSRTSNNVTVEDPSYTTFGIGVLPGISYKITDNIDIEASIGYLGFNNRSSKETVTIGTTSTEVKTSENDFGFSLSSGLSLGFVYKF